MTAFGAEVDPEVNKVPVRREAWLCDDPVWWRPPRSERYRPMSDDDRAAIRAEFVEHGRIAAYPAVVDNPAAAG